MNDYTISVRHYDENDDWEGVEWKITKKQAEKFRMLLNEIYGQGTDL